MSIRICIDIHGQAKNNSIEATSKHFASRAGSSEVESDNTVRDNAKLKPISLTNGKLLRRFAQTKQKKVAHLPDFGSRFASPVRA